VDVLQAPCPLHASPSTAVAHSLQKGVGLGVPPGSAVEVDRFAGRELPLSEKTPLISCASCIICERPGSEALKYWRIDTGRNG
jgi:hypothetical protein